jgi:5-methylcytosine-specific restriction enzyme subunit McrC
VKPTAGILREFKIAEWETLRIKGETLTPSDQRLKEELQLGEEGRLLIDELRTGVRITARSWVGVVRFERFEVRVVPKLAGDNIGLVEMIEFATGLDALRRSSSARSLHAEGAGLFDLIALLLAESAELILRSGLLADYVEREDELPVLRGRLLGDRQVLRRFGQVDRLVCRFDEHDRDISENQLLAAALSRCSTRVTHESVRRRVRRLLAIFQEACRPDALVLEEIRDRMIYHRLNAHYRDPHALAWLILDGLGTRDVLITGETNCFAFLIDMNRLFEMFVFRLVDTLLAGSAMRVHYQRADRSIILNASTGQPYARVVPDILVERRDAVTATRLAIDAKYKLYDERKLSNADVYQTFLYAYAYGEAGGRAIPAALLVYPSSSLSSRAVRLRVRSAQSLAAAEILALGLSIPGALAEVAGDIHGPVTKALIEGVLQGLGDLGDTAA